ncbi:MAG TPA: DUF6220 domain-containing protein [Herpetosiphonaceae bacterium]
MTSLTDPGTNPDPRRRSPIVHVSRIIYLLLAGLFAGGIAIQVFLAGAGVLVNPSYFVMHTTFGHILELFPLLLLIVGLVARLPWRLLGLTALLFVLFMLQYFFLYGVASVTGLVVLRAFHAVNALAMFWAALYLFGSTRKLLRAAPPVAHQSPTPSIA